MDYFSMKRKELQALCKEHNIPANSANSVLADKLSQLFKVKEKPVTRKRACLKGSVETTNEDDPAVSKREVKKVRFSPNNDVREYKLQSGKKHVATPINKKTRRQSMATKVDKLVVDSDSTNELSDDSVQIPVKRSTRAQGRGAAGDVAKEANVVKEAEGNFGKVTRSKANILAKGNVIQPEESKQNKRPVKDVKKRSESVEETEVVRVRATRSKVQGVTDDNMGLDVNPRVKKGSESVEGTAVGRVRATRSKAQAVTDDNTGLDVNPQVKKGSESVEETAVGRVRATRSKTQAVTDDNMVLDLNPQVSKKRAGQVAENVQNVEVSDKLLEIPARVTRSRQNSKEDMNNMVSNLKAEKKRTRREMKATDHSSNLSNVAAEDKQELPKRKSLRTRGVENMDEDEGDKEEVVNGGRATRAKAQLAVESGRDGKSRAEKKAVVPIELKAVQKPEESIKKAGRKNVNQRKFVIPSENSKAVIHSEEPVNRRTRNTRSKSVMPEAQEKVNEEPEVVGSPAVDKKQAKGKSVDVTKSGKVTSESKTAVNATGSPKSRKRRGTPVTEDQDIESSYAVVDESARRSTRSAGESEGNSAANKQVASVKTPTPGIGKQSVLRGELTEGNQRSTRQALRSGVTTRGDSSSKRAKLSAPKQSDTEYSAVKSSKKGTPVSKLLNFEPGEKVVETELTPAVDRSRSQTTRSAIRSDKTVGSLKKPSQTSVKKQPIGDAQISTRKAAKFRPDPAVNTAPGRVTRSGIKDGGNASSYYAVKVEKKKPSRSAHQVPLDDAQISAPEVAEASPNPDVDTLGVQSEVYTEAMGGISGNTEMRLPTIVAEENAASVTETAVLVESVSAVLGEKSSGADVGEGMEVADASIGKSSIQFTPDVAIPETVVMPCPTESLLGGTRQKSLDLPSFGDEPLLVPNLSETPLQSLSEVEVQIAVNPEKLNANETDSAETGFVSAGQQTDVMVEEQVVSIEKTVVMDVNAGASLGDAENESDLGFHNVNSSAVYQDSFEQPDVMSTEEVEWPVEQSHIENGSEQGAEDERASAPTPLTTKLVSEDSDVTLDQATDDDKLQGLFSAENDTKDIMEAADGSLMEQNVMPAVENITYDDVADVPVDTGNESAEQLKSDVLQSPDVMSTKKVERPAEPSNVEGGSEHGAEDDSASAPMSLTATLVSEDNDDTLDQATDDGKLQGPSSTENDIEDGMDAAHCSLMEPNVLPAIENITSDDVADVSVDAVNEPAKQLEPDVLQSPDVMSTKELKRPVEPSNAEDGSEHGAEDESASALMPLTETLVSEGNDDTLDQETDDGKLQGLYSTENDLEDGMDAAHGSLMEPNVLPAVENRTSDDVADFSVDARNEPTKELESDVVQSPEVMSTKEVERPVEPSNVEDASEHGAEDERGSALMPSTGTLVSEDNDDTLDQATDDGKLQGLYSAENDIEDGMDAAYGSLMEPNMLPAEQNANSDDCADVSVNVGNEPAKELESDVVQYTGTDVHQSPILSRSDNEDDSPVFGKPEEENDSHVLGIFGEDANVNTGKECETDEGLNSEHLVEDPVLSGGDGDDEDASTDKEHGSNPELNNKNDNSYTLGKNDYFNMTKQPEPTSEPSSFNDITETPYSANDISIEDQKAHLKPLYGNDVFGTPVIGKDDVLIDAGNEPTKDRESDAGPSTDSDVPIFGTTGDENDIPIFGTSVSGKFDGEAANVNDCETDKGVNSNKEHLLQETELRGGEDDDVNPTNEQKSDQTLVTGNDDDFSMTKQPEPISEPSSLNDINEIPFSGSDIREETLDSYGKPLTGNDIISTPVIGQDDVKDHTISVPKELETGLEPSNDNESLEVHVSGNAVDSEYVVADQSDEQDGESERDKSASNDCPGTDEQDVEGDDLEPENNENMPAETEISISSFHQESVQESSIARDGLGSIEVTDIKNDGENEQITIETSENIEGLSKESESVYPGMSDEQFTEETNMTKEIDHASTSESLDGGSNLGADEFDTQLVGDIEAYEYSTRQGSPPIMFTQEFSALPTSSNENDGNEQGETQEMDACQNLEDYTFRMDEQKPISANESYVLDESQKDNQASDINTSARTSFFREESSSSAAGLVDSVKNYDKASGHMTDGKSTQADLMRENPNPNMNEETFDWTGAGSSMKSLFTTPAPGQIQYVKDDQDDAVDFVDQDQYLSQDSLFTMAATTTNTYAKGDQEGPADFANLNDYSSLKSFFSTPATATISHTEGGQEDQVQYSNQYHYSSVKSLFTTPATATVSHLQRGQDYAISSAFPDNRCNQGETNMEDSTNKLFEDELDGSSDGSGNHFEYNSRRFDYPAGAAGTGHHEASGFKEDSIDSGSYGEEKETQMKGPKAGDNNSF